MGLSFLYLAHFLNDAFSFRNSRRMVTLVYSNAVGSFASWFVLKLRSAIKLNVLFSKKLDGHVVYGIDLLFKYDGLEQRFNTSISLHVSMLSYKERDTALSKTFGIFTYHVVAHYLHVAPIGLKKEITYNMRL